MVVGDDNIRLKSMTRCFMQYLLLLYANEAGWSNMTKLEQERGVAAYAAYGEALKAAGALQGSNRLQPIGTATTVRKTNGKAQVLDGPYVDSKEQLGGYYLIDVPDLDAALSWAARCPGAGHGVVEVRPIWSMTDYSPAQNLQHTTA
jgi:hypothetical protein